MNNIILNAIGPVVHIIAGLIVPIWFYAVSAGSRVSGADWRVLVFSIFLSLLPDIDTQTSTIGRAFPFIAEPIERRYGHRQITHSLLALLILGLILWLTFPQDWWLLLSAYGSHLIIDTLTGTQGIPLLWPAQLRFYLLRIRPKSTGEVLLGFFCVLALVAPYFTVTHQFIATLTPPEETLVLRPTPTPIPTPTPATFTIKINRVYDIDTEILVHVGDTITHGQKIANLTTHRLLQATPTPTQTPTASPTITPSPPHLVTPSPFPTPDPLYIAELNNQRSLAHARYIRAITAPTPDPNKRAAAPAYNLAIREKIDCINNTDTGDWRNELCKKELHELEATAIVLLATSPPVDPLDTDIAYYQWQAAEIRYQQALAQLTPRPTIPPTATSSPTSSPPHLVTPSPPHLVTLSPTPTPLPQADPFTVYAQISGEVAAINLASIEGNSVTVQIIVLVDETDPLFINPFAGEPPPTNNDQLPPQDTLLAQIIRVIDGDTVTVLFLQGEFEGQEETIRLLGINTPETVKPNVPIECYGPEASAFTKNMLPQGIQLFIELDEQIGERDKYGRLLAHIWLPDESGRTLLNETLLQQGFARFNNYGNPTSYDGRYQAAEATAAASQAGLWKACP